MAVNVCPIASVNAPVETVWRLLSNPSAYALWWDAETRSIVPAGPAQPGQEIHAQTRGPGKAWDVHIVVNRVEAEKRQIDLKTRLPFGITVLNHITVMPLDDRTSRVTFG